MQRNRSHSTNTFKSNREAESRNNLQRPPYLELLGNQFIQHVLNAVSTPPNSSETHFDELINKMPERDLFSALQTIKPFGLSTIFKNRGWGVIEFIKALPHLPETFILELDALSSSQFGASIDYLFPLGQGFHARGVIDADVDCLHTSDEGIITILRQSPDVIHVENRHQHAVGFGATMGGKSDLFGRNWDTELEGQITASAHIFEVYDFPIRNPLLLLPLMKTHGGFDTDLTKELFHIVAPDGYKKYRQSVTYGLENQGDALAEYNLEHPKLIDICLAFGIESHAGVELHLPKKEAGKPQKYELTIAGEVGFSTKSGLLFAQAFGVPVDLVQQGAELGARISGSWKKHPGQDELTVNRFELLASHNPEADYEVLQPATTEVSLAWAPHKEEHVDENEFEWPTEIRISLIRPLDLAIGGIGLSPELAPILEDMGIDINSQLQLSMTLVIPQKSLLSLWGSIEKASLSPSEFLSSMQEKFFNEHNNVLSYGQIAILLKNAHLTCARLRVILQLDAKASIKAGFIAGLGFKSAAAIGSFREVNLLKTDAAIPIKDSLIGLVSSRNL